MTEPMTRRPAHSFSERIIGALKLDPAIYDEVEHDEGALQQAAIVVAVAAVFTGFGAPDPMGSLVVTALGALLGWLVSAAFLWFVGVRWLEHTSDFPELLRTLGFASAPYLFMLLAILPLLGPLVALVVLVWGLAAYVVAVREALDTTTGGALVVCVLAYAAKLLTVFLLMLLTGVLSAAI